MEVDKIAKEILKEEILSEEELDNVSGGTIAETVKDSQLLHALGLIDRAYTASEVQSNLDGVWKVMDSAIFEAYGHHHSLYDYTLETNSANEYYYQNRATKAPCFSYGEEVS